MRSEKEINEALEVVLIGLGAMTMGGVTEPGEMLLSAISVLAWVTDRQDIPGIGNSFERLLGGFKRDLDGFKAAAEKLKRSREN